MTTQFKREERYYVLKISDMKKYLSAEKQEAVRATAEKLNAGRAVDGKPVLQAVVIESDWPEYKRVWQMIETRMITTRSQFLNCNNDRRFWAIPEPAQEEPIGEAYLCNQCKTPFDGAFQCPSCGHGSATKEPVYTMQERKRDDRLDIESALSELIEKICPNLDTGNLLNDAKTASQAIDLLKANQEEGESAALSMALREKHD